MGDKGEQSYNNHAANQRVLPENMKIFFLKSKSKVIIRLVL